MKRYLAAVSFLLTLCALPLYAAEKPPAGMEYKKIGDARVLVPKGTRIRKEGDLNVVEDISEYSSRRFVDIDGRLDKAESDYAGLADDMKSAFEGIESRLKKMEESILRMRDDVEKLKAKNGTPETPAP